MNTIFEWCPHCEGEVELPIELGRYNCPSCNESIINCSVCYTDGTDCSKCLLDKEEM